MNDLNKELASEPGRGVQSAPEEIPASAYDDPKAGGSYLRDPETGELVRMEPDQPEKVQE